MARKISRKNALSKIGAGMAILSITPSSFANQLKNLPSVKISGKMNHSVCQWCYNNIPLESLCEAALEIGIKSIELLGPEGWSTVKKIQPFLCHGQWKSIGY